MQKLTRKISAALSAFILAVALMFSPCPGFFRPVGGSLGGSALLIRAEEQPVTDESKGIAALLTLLFANGIRFVGEWENVSDGAVKLWNDFTTATGNTVTLAALGAGVAIQHGYMRTSATVNNAVNAFQSWYEGAFSVPSTGNVNVPIGGGGVAFVSVPFAGLTLSNGLKIKPYYDNSDNKIVALSGYVWLTSTNMRQSWNFSGLSDVNQFNVGTYTNYNGKYFTPLSNTGGEGAVSASIISVYGSISAESNIANAYLYAWGGATLPDTVIEGQSYDLKDGYNLNNDQSLLLDIANLSALVASIGLTLDSINDLVQDWPAIFDTPWSDTDVPDITFPVPIEDTPDNTIPWVNVPDAVSPDPVPDYVPDTPAGEGEYKVLGLDKVFPFSIPFDLYYLATVLVAEPETPSFTYALYNPKTASLVTQEVDLHQFDTIAALLRKLETVLFIAALIFVTRGLIRS